MASKSVMLLTAALVLPVLGKSPEIKCKAVVHDNRGHRKEFHEGNHGNLGSWNDRITTFEVKGGSGCQGTFCEHSDFRGRCVGPVPNGHGLNFPPGSEIRSKISSIKVRKSRRRAESDLKAALLEDLPEDFEFFELENNGEDDTYDPLCSAVYHELLETREMMFANHTIKEWGMQNIVSKCDDSFTDAEDIFQCQFYAYAAAEIFDDERILETLHIDGDEAGDMLEEYRRCGLLNVEINKIVKSGKMSGVSIEHHDDGDFFRLDEPLTAESVDLVPNGGGKFQAVVSAGALLAMWIGSTLVRVCKDFDVQTGAWLLAQA